MLFIVVGPTRMPLVSVSNSEKTTSGLCCLIHQRQLPHLESSFCSCSFLGPTASKLGSCKVT